MIHSIGTNKRWKKAAWKRCWKKVVEEKQIFEIDGAEIEEAIVQMATELPAYGQERVSNELRRRGHTISPTGVRSVWLRHNLETRKKRLTALEKKVAEEGIVLTEAQVAALETQRRDDEAHGEIETHYPGFLGSQDTSTWAPSRELAASISKRLSTRIRRLRSRSCIRTKRRSHRRTC